MSVVIPTRDRLPYLKQAVASVIEQPLPDWELIVVDDASSDGTPDWLDRVEDPRIKSVVLKEHSERHAGLNRGLAEAQGEFVIFLDDDDRLAKGALLSLTRGLRTTPGAVAAIGALRFFNDDGHTRKMPHVRLVMKGSVWPAILAGWNVGRGQLLTYREIASRVGGWNNASVVSEDTDFAMRVCRTGKSVVVPSVVLEKRMHPQNPRSPDFSEQDRAIRLGFLDSLTGEDRETAIRSLRFFDDWMEGHSLYHDHADYRGAVRSYRRAIAECPSLLSSPLRWTIVQGVAKAAAGSLPLAPPLLNSFRRANMRLRRRVGKYPDLGSPPKVRGREE